MSTVKSANAQDKAHVVDMNSEIDFPVNQARKKNKNDFYRFLVQQNLSAEALANPDLKQHLMISKVNNDILIPRSILKRNNHPAARPKPDGGQFDFVDELEDIDNANLLYNEAVVGRQLDTNAPLLRPRFGVHDYLESQYKTMQLHEQVTQMVHQAQANENEKQMEGTRDANVQNTTMQSIPVPKIPFADKQNKPYGDETIKLSGKARDSREPVDQAGSKESIESYPTHSANRHLNMDLEVDQEPKLLDAEQLLRIKKKIVRTAAEDGFFKTGVDIQEHEEIDFEGTLAQNAAEMFRKGQMTAAQIKELLQKKLKDDRIFGFDNFDDFNQKYFKKELVAFEEFYKIRQLKYARIRYNNRMGEKPFGLMAHNNLTKIQGSEHQPSARLATQTTMPNDVQ